MRVLKGLELAGRGKDAGSGWLREKRLLDERLKDLRGERERADTDCPPAVGRTFRAGAVV